MREPLTVQEARLLGFITKYKDKELKLQAYAVFMQSGSRWTRILMSRLLKKGYIKRVGEIEGKLFRPGNVQVMKMFLIDEEGNEIV